MHFIIPEVRGNCRGVGAHRPCRLSRELFNSFPVALPDALPAPDSIGVQPGSTGVPVLGHV